MTNYGRKGFLWFVFAALLIALVCVCACDTAPIFLPAQTPTPTAAPTPSPTPTPTPFLTFSPENFPDEDGKLSLLEDYPLSGKIDSNYPLTAVILSDTCAYNDDPLYPYEQAVTFGPGGAAFYQLADADTAEGLSLDELFDFSALTTGVHTLKLSAVCSGCEKLHELHEVSFYILSNDWERIKKSDFNGSYDAALAFFGDRERFCYRYQRVFGRYTVADPAWEDAYITSLDGFCGRDWLVHIDAVPYYEKAFDYLRRTLIRVHGTNGDTGVLPLSHLIYTYNGSYVSRFTSSLKTISHHAFGAASDVNAKLTPNLNNKENKQLIDAEVRELLAYNGILTENGVSYYDFTYVGHYDLTENGVPESIVNYLLYELAFYRAGFLWGHYYKSTSDGMHFTLSDRVSTHHEDDGSLRKIFSYLD